MSPQSPPMVLQQACSSGVRDAPGSTQRKAGAAVQHSRKATANMYRALRIMTMIPQRPTVHCCRRGWLQASIFATNGRLRCRTESESPGLNRREFATGLRSSEIRHDGRSGGSRSTHRRQRTGATWANNACISVEGPRVTTVKDATAFGHDA